MHLFLFVVSSLALKWVAANNFCGDYQLPCDNGWQCINREEWCDKTSNCEDNSDEAYCKEAGWFSNDPNKCEETHFLCINGNCVPKVAKCDQHEDCKDGSDEEDCGKSEEKTTSMNEASSKESNSSPESNNESESSGELDENEPFTEILPIQKSHSESSSSLEPTESSVFSHEQSPLPTGFYDVRRKEIERSSIPKISAPTHPPDIFRTQAMRTISTRGIIPLSTTPIPPTRRYYNYSQPVSRETYNKLPHPVNRPSIYVNRPSVYNTNQPTYIRHPSHYDNLPSTYNRPPTSHDSRQLNYGRHSTAYERHPSGYGIRPSTFGRNAYHGYPSNVLNGEPAWRPAESLRPYKSKTDIMSPFYFAKDYGKLYGQRNTHHQRQAKNWLLGQRDSSGGWGNDTPRALVALALTNGNFSEGIQENELMKRNFLIQLGINVLRNNSKSFSLNRLALTMNALLAVCENPRDFHGIDLTDMMNVKISEYLKSRHRSYINPFIYLSQCLSGKSLGSSDVQTLMKQMHISSYANEVTKDMQSIAILAYSCYVQQNFHDPSYQRSLQSMLQNAVSKLLQRMYSDGSFGSVYSTSLAAQALISVNDSNDWEAEKTLDFLKQQQLENGSFGNMLATYYALPVISGRSLLHLRNVRCEPPAVIRDLTPPEILEYPGPRQYVHYSIYFNYPLTNSYSIRVLVPEGINLLDMMRVAEHQDKNFRFAYGEDDKHLQVYSASGLPNDPEQGLAWHLYVKRESSPQQYDLNSGELYSGDVRKYLPKSDDHVILWYHPNALYR